MHSIFTESFGKKKRKHQSTETYKEKRKKNEMRVARKNCLFAYFQLLFSSRLFD
jgi:hypothetical protein